MILDGFPRVLWINLQRSKDRYQIMSDLCKSYNLQNHRIEAVDGLGAWAHLERYVVPNPTLTKKETACSISHLSAIMYFLHKMTDPYVVIFEDDVSFEFLQYIPYNWSTFMNSLPNDWQVVQLSVSELEPISDINLIRTQEGDGRYCSAAYLINREGAKNILDQYFSPRVNKYVLYGKYHPTSDQIICHTVPTYSIPIFTYHNNSSTIHPEHLVYHIASKDHQQKVWEGSVGSQ